MIGIRFAGAGSCFVLQGQQKDKICVGIAEAAILARLSTTYSCFSVEVREVCGGRGKIFTAALSASLGFDKYLCSAASTGFQ